MLGADAQADLIPLMCTANEQGHVLMRLALSSQIDLHILNVVQQSETSRHHKISVNSESALQIASESRLW